MLWTSTIKIFRVLQANHMIEKHFPNSFLVNIRSLVRIICVLKKIERFIREKIENSFCFSKNWWRQQKIKWTMTLRTCFWKIVQHSFILASFKVDLIIHFDKILQSV